MVDVDTFLTALYVMADDFCSTQLPKQTHPGPDASLSRSEVVALACFGQWGIFPNESAFYRYAETHLRPFFPTLPDRSQFNRLERDHRDAIALFSLRFAELLNAGKSPFEVLDGTGAPVRHCKRRGEGWLAGQADIGWSNRLGWYEGFHVLVAVNPEGVITGFGFAPASTKDQPLAESFLALRRQPNPRLVSVGEPPKEAYYYTLADKGFEGRRHHQHWEETYGAKVICPPKRGERRRWSRPLRRWHASLRQIVETVNDKLHNVFRLGRERPHDLTGFQARLAAKVALHNFCIWLNQQLGRPLLAFADLVAW